MARRSESSLATLLLTTRLFERKARPLSPREYWSLVRGVGEPAELFGRDRRSIVEPLGGRGDLGERVSALLDEATRIALDLERLELAGFAAVTPYDPAYPRRLRDRLQDDAPPVLFAVGPLELLSADGLAIVGSRAASEEAREVAARAARIAVRAGKAVISGGAKGVDQTSMAAAFQAGGQVLGILAGGLEARVRDRETRHVIAEGRVCLASPYAPSAGFTVGGAMARNKLIYALAERTLVVAADLERGGTWAGATEALKRNLGPVLVWVGPGAGRGNRALADAGAIPVDDLEALVGPGTGDGAGTEQLGLEL